MPKKVSVLIPVYNGEKYIREAVYSVLSQTHPVHEVLVWDDASTDSTVQVVKSIGDSRVKLRKSSKNKGVAFTRNKLLEMAVGDVLMNQDADDISYPNRVQVLLTFMEMNKLVFTCSSLKLIDSDIVFRFETNAAVAVVLQYATKKAFAGNSCMFSRLVVDAGIRYDDRLVVGEDTLFEAEIQHRFPYRMRAIDEVLYLYRKHPASLTAKRRRGVIGLSEELMIERNDKIKSILKGLVA